MERELHVLPDLKQELAKCDGYALYGRPEVNDTDVVKVPEAPPHRVGRDLAHLIPVWSQVLHRGDLEKYDWVVQIEYDHILRPSAARKTIAKYYRALQNGTQEDQANLDKAMMFQWGNAFLFNQKALKQMKREWAFLGKTRTSDGYDNGCPEWYFQGKQHPTVQPQAVTGTPDDPATKCPQDAGYPMMVDMMMTPKVAKYGKPACNKIGFTKKGDPLPMGCANLDTGSSGAKGGSETAQLQEVAKISQHVAIPIQVHGGTHDIDLYEVPIWHRVYSPKVHALTRTLLLDN